MSYKISPRQLAVYVAQGLTSHEIAHALHIPVARPDLAVLRICVRLGIPLPRLTRPRRVVRLGVWDRSVVALCAQGVSPVVIGQILGLSKSQVSWARVRHARAQQAGELADSPHLPVWWARKADCARRAALLADDQVRLAHHHLKTAPATARALGIGEYVVRRCVKAAKDAR